MSDPSLAAALSPATVPSLGPASLTPETAHLLRAMFGRVVAAAQPAAFMRAAVRRHLSERPKGRTMVVGAGKAAGSMAAAFEDAYEGELSGLVVTRYGYGVPARRIEILEAAHPVPDERSLEATNRLLAALDGLTPDDLVVALVSGGGSALLCAPAPGLTLADKQALNRALLVSGAPIEAMNSIRKHVSAIKGGRLAKAAMPARLVSFFMSDVPGDGIGAIASGPTVADETTLADARGFVERYGVVLPPVLLAALSNPANETPKPGDACFATTANHLVMTPGMAIETAMALAQAAGYEVLFLGADIEGEASKVAADHAALALEALEAGRKLCLLSGGETTVTLKAKGGRGGRNTEYLLALAIALDGAPGINALAGDTDGVDGSQDNAGAYVGPRTLSRAKAHGIDLHRHLANNDAYSAFERLSDLLMTGPTMTNVNDFRAILVDPG